MPSKVYVDLVALRWVKGVGLRAKGLNTSLDLGEDSVSAHSCKLQQSLTERGANEAQPLVPSTKGS